MSSTRYIRITLSHGNKNATYAYKNDASFKFGVIFDIKKCSMFEPIKENG